MILEVDEINTFYGTSHILFDVSLSVERGEIVCILGRNGAGKTTTVRSIMGLTRPKSGSVRFHGREVRGRPPYTIAKMGMGYVPDNRLIFPDLTVRENLELARKTPKEFSGKPWTVDGVYELFPLLRRLLVIVPAITLVIVSSTCSTGRTVNVNPTTFQPNVVFNPEPNLPPCQLIYVLF